MDTPLAGTQAGFAAIAFCSPSDQQGRSVLASLGLGSALLLLSAPSAGEVDQEVATIRADRASYTENHSRHSLLWNRTNRRSHGRTQ